MEIFILIAFVAGVYFIRVLFNKAFDKGVEVVCGAGSRKLVDEEERYFETSLSPEEARYKVMQYLKDDMDVGLHDVRDLDTDEDGNLKVILRGVTFLLHFGKGQVIVALTESRVDHNNNISIDIRKKIDNFYATIRSVVME